MSTVDGQSAPGGSPSTEPADLKLEAVVIPWPTPIAPGRSTSASAGGDFSFDNGFRVVQFTAAHAGADGTAMTVEDDWR